jgi:exosortase/archaeosortase family protein
VRVVIAMSAIPVAILSNALRVAGTGIAAHYYGSAAAEGFFHSFSGWIVFIAAFVMLFGIIRALRWLMPEPITGRNEMYAPLMGSQQ